MFAATSSMLRCPDAMVARGSVLRFRDVCYMIRVYYTSGKGADLQNMDCTFTTSFLFQSHASTVPLTMMHSHKIPELEQIPQKIQAKSSNLEVQPLLLP